MLAVDVVEDAGFIAVEAKDAQEAILILENRLDIRVMFTDIDMPGSLNGLALAAHVRDRWPPIEIILTSGHAFPLHHELPKGAVFIPKPYVLSLVVERLKKLIR
jgi:CheY-like chemotaxis protein